MRLAFIVAGIFGLCGAVSVVEPSGEPADDVILSRYKRQETGVEGGVTGSGSQLLGGCFCCDPSSTKCCASGQTFVPIGQAGCCCSEADVQACPSTCQSISPCPTTCPASSG